MCDGPFVIPSILVAHGNIGIGPKLEARYAKLRN